MTMSTLTAWPPAMERLPWMLPVPLRKSTFTALHREHRAYNVEVDLAAAPAFSPCDTMAPPESLLWCDLQAMVDYPMAGHLGAGRSGIYRGKYLKGIGRTRLTTSWNSRRFYHLDGCLFPTSALREYLVSQYFRVIGHDDAIIPCEGILLRPLDESSRRKVSRTLKRYGGALIDRRLQAISLKPAGHLRLSNLIWHLQHLGFDEAQGHLHFASFFESLASYLAASLGVTASAKDMLPERIADRFCAVVGKAPKYFAATFAAGVDWMSCGNNSCVDGRFLDLEIALPLGAPLPLLYSPSTEPSVHYPGDDSGHFGLNLIHYGREVHFFGRYLQHAVRFFLREFSHLPPPQRRYLAAFDDAWTAMLRRDTFWPRSAASIAEKNADLIAKGLRLTKKERLRIASYARFELDRVTRVLCRTPRPQRFDAFSAARSFPLEPVGAAQLFALPGFTVDSDTRDRIRFFRELFDELHQIADVDRLLEATATAERRIERAFRKNGRQGVSP